MRSEDTYIHTTLYACVLAYNKSPCRRQTVWVAKIHRFYNVTTTWRNVFLIPETFRLVFKWYVCYIDEFRSLFFRTFFRCFLCRGTPRSQTELEVTPCLQCGMGITSDVMWTRCQKMMRFGYSAWISACHVMLVNQCNGRIDCKRFLMDQSRRVVLPSFPKNTPCAMVVLF